MGIRVGHLIIIVIFNVCILTISAFRLDNSVSFHQRHRRFTILELRSGNNTLPCPSDSAEDFPDIFTVAQNERGGVIVALLVAIYCFTILAIICDNYFLPCVERICEALNLSQDVAAATFMSVATTAPELFVNIIGTFITESDIGIGTVVGSSLFNALGVASLGGLAASAPLQLHWWPLTRDVIIYILSIILLVCITWDGIVYWYEGLLLFIVYFLYFTIMFQNVRISRFIKNLIKRIKNNKIGASKSSDNTNNNTKRLSVAVVSHYGSYMEEITAKSEDKEKETEKVRDDDESNLFALPKGSIFKKIFFFYSFPIKFLLYFTIPSPIKHPKLFPVTFIMCIFFIGVNSYLVSWMITIIGNTFHIPDAVLGLTFLAAGGCLPEAISITIMSRRGEGSMGVSNSLGANTMNILLSLGMPWFLKTILMGTDDTAFIRIYSGSLEYTILGLIFVAIILYVTLYLNKFRLSRTIGYILILVYMLCVILAILSEMVFFKMNCET